MAESLHRSRLAKSVAAAVWRQVEQRRCIPRAMYRLEFHRERMRFRDACGIVPYLASLGISHLYTSPCFKSSAAANHGYAIVDYDQLDPALGTREEFDELAAALHQHGMGLILDVVPNHMAAAAGENAWWDDVLQHGECSPKAAYFDIDWHSSEPALRHRLLFPILGDSFGKVLEQRQLQLSCESGRFRISYYHHLLPVEPGSYQRILEPALALLRPGPEDDGDVLELESILTAIRHLPPRTIQNADQQTERIRETLMIQSRLAALMERSCQIGETLERVIQSINGDVTDPASFNQLERLLDEQVYRLARWKTASDEINYRRFFDVNELAAVCTERLEVFRAGHRLIFDLLADGAVSGLRIDHVDGLYDPCRYLWQLQWGYLEVLVKRELQSHFATSVNEVNQESLLVLQAEILDLLHQWLGGPSPESLLNATSGTDCSLSSNVAWQAPPPLYVIVEKILGENESVPAEWPVAGTTGYDFLNQANGLFVNPTGLARIRRSYHRFSRTKERFDEIATDAKRLILNVAMSSELHLLARRLKRVAERTRHSRDFTLNSLIAGLREILVAFPVYRTYFGDAPPSHRDEQVILNAVRTARRRNPAMDRDLFEFIQSTLLVRGKTDDIDAQRLDLFISRFQQVSSPVMAKGIEDTAFYQDVALTSLNEVGSHLPHATISVERFHALNQERVRCTPHGMNCTSTHDTKRCEDVRAKLNTLSEIPDLWRTSLARWSRWNRHFFVTLQGERAPSKNDEYLFYQTVVGIWPGESPAASCQKQLMSRLLQYMQKATHEAKLHTSWISPNFDYDEALQHFIQGVLRTESHNRFLEEVQSLVRLIEPAAKLNSLSSVLLKMTSPGVPDIYQGCEIWDDSLVDPDNRRPVDFSYRRKLLAQVQQRISPVSSCEGDRRWGDEAKLSLIWRLLESRRKYAELFAQGEYIPLTLTGPLAEFFCSFLRRDSSSKITALIVAPRLCFQFLSLKPAELEKFNQWSEMQSTSLQIPSGLEGLYRNRFGSESIDLSSKENSLSKLLIDCPYGLWVST